ncbi:MAG: hypothetical protein NZ750_06270 [Anaerolineae bacterium]|nr:hypothetical protein [Anaerolineae bacterium]
MITAYVFLAALYALFNPPYEAPDEVFHFAMIHKLATDGQLAVQDVNAPATPWHQQGSQPPLYYALSAVLVAGIDRSDYWETRQPNPQGVVGQPGKFRNKNAFIHDDYPAPPRGTWLAIYVARGLSIACGALTVYAVYQSARVIAPKQKSLALWALALTAFNPQFIFISSTANNDNLVTAFNSVILWQTLVMLRDGFNTPRSLLLGVLAALASISKLSGLTMGVAVALAGAWVLWKSRDWRGFIVLGLLGLLSWTLLASWWYARNWILYGEFFGTQTMLDLFGRRIPTPDLLTLIREEWEGLRISYWGLFGLFSLYVPLWFYPLMDALTLLSLAGWVWAVWRLRHQPILPSVLWIGVVGVLGIASFISWTLQVYASQGRLLFGFIAAYSLSMALGLDALRLPSRAGLLGLMSFSALMPFAVLIPTYAPTPPLDSLPASATPFYARMGEDVVLVGYELEDRLYREERIPIVLYWQVLRPVQEDYAVSVELVRQTDTRLGVTVSYPNYGARRTSRWQVGLIYRDLWWIDDPYWITPTFPSQFPMYFHISLWKLDEGRRLPIYDETGAPLGIVRLRAGGVAHPAPEPAQSIEGQSGNLFGPLRLLGYDWQDKTGQLRLTWRPIRSPHHDYAIGVHIVDEHGRLVGQADSEPNLPTRYWQAEQRYLSDHRLDFDSLPQGRLEVFVMVYSRESGARLDNGTPSRTLLLLNLKR